MSREAFERWYAEETGEPNVRRYADSRGVYTHLAMQSAWLGWKAALESQAAQPQVPEGYVLVPVEPTENMMNAGHAAAWRRIPSIFDLRDAKEVYQAMLAASQEKGE